MYEIDFLPVEAETGPGSKSGDAIAVRMSFQAENRNVVIVFDGGFTGVGDDLAHHIQQYFQTSVVDVVVSTHPDADHINGIAKLVNRLQVKELLIHRPRLHTSNITGFSNLEAVDDLLKLAQQKGILVTEPFTGVNRFNGQLFVLGPTEAYYEALLEQHLTEARSNAAAATPTMKSLLATLFSAGTDLLTRVIPSFPLETLSNDGVTGPRNDTSAITLLQADDHNLMFTGDAGIPALTMAADVYEASLGSFATEPLTFFQVPHHGSRHNLGPALLNRIIGPIGHGFAATVAFISSAKASKKHPSPKVTNALGRRGAVVVATEGRTINQSHNAAARPGWQTVPAIPPLREDDDGD